MKYPTVSALCEGVASAIRDKEGSTEKINPQDFADRIKGLEVGGGGDEWVYYDLRNQENREIFSVIAGMLPHSLVAILEYGIPKLQYGVQYQAYIDSNPEDVRLGNILGFSYLASHKIKNNNAEYTGSEFVALVAQQMGAADILDSTPKITKEQFYSLE